MDAMQVMSLNGLGALGVVTGETEWEGEPSSLVAVVTANDCSKLVVPSEGKQALGMGLGDMCKNVMAEQHGGRERGEERVPGEFKAKSITTNGHKLTVVHTITPGTTLLHAANMLLATSSSRVFLRTPPASSPPLSPVTSFERLTPPTSPELVTSFPGLPDPPRTHISSQYVISILDILSCLARAYQSKLPAADPTADDMLPDNMSKRRRRASSSAAFDGFQTWRWAGDPDPSPFSQ
jgi:glycine/D-amino acid oxidase-like deaminating enzyme